MGDLANSVRRRALLAALVATGWRGGWAAVPQPASAPTRQRAWHAGSIRIVVAYPPGGVSDTIARSLGERLAEQLGVGVRIENRPGASGLLAMELVARSAADGSILCFGAVTAAALMLRTRGVAASGWPVIPVAGVMRTPVLVVGTPSLEANTFAAMLTRARSHPGSIRWATTGEGSTGHAVLEHVRRASGATIVHVPYKGGGQQLTDALGGHFEVLSTNVAAQQLEAVRQRRLVALAVGAPARLPVLPETPTLAELGFADANLDSLFGLFAPPETDPLVVKALHAEVSVALRHSGLRSQLLAMSNTPFEGSQAEFAWQVRREANR